MKKHLSTEPYKGVRDFYPEDQFVQEFMFEAMRAVCERFGYESYNASILEPTELYTSKTSEEIVNEQTYTFIDRGDRSVTLRPEMTPTVTRLVAGKRRELSFPLRLYSVQNFFRYERPQRGRLREFWQLNADLFGAEGTHADAEIISLAHALLLELGASEHDFEIHINDRRIFGEIAASLDLSEDETLATQRLLDKKDKLEDFTAQFYGLLGEARAREFLEALSRSSSNAHLEELLSILSAQGIRNVVIDTSLARGFDYYTGMVFEVFDTASENRRSLMGGGRYDNLLSLFDDEPMPIVGFAMGDVTARDFLESHNLLPTYRPATELMICALQEDAISHAERLAQELRDKDVAVAVNFSLKRVGDQIKHANKLHIPFILCVGDHERESGMYTLKHLASGTERTLSAEHIAEHLFSAQG
jgi:histidyl-tRNA synthetase